MASETEQMTFPFRLWVDKASKHLVFAEATGDFVDTLFSFLTLPLGTIIRLISKKQPAEIGCIHNLYKSVENFDTEDFWNHICKQMLLRPRNPCEALCEKLKLNVSSIEPTKYFMCNSCLSLLSTFPEAECTCGRLMNKEMKLKDSAEDVEVKNGVFVASKAMYLILDDLKVMECSLDDSFQQLSKRGFKDLSNLTDMAQEVGLNKILDLLKQALTSKSPLSDVFLELENVVPNKVESFRPKLGASEAGNCKMNLEITVSKSRNKVLYAEAEENFIDFLLSFLTIPLGSVLKLLDGKSCVGCIDNFYSSVKGLSPSLLHGSCSALLDPGVAPQFGSQNQPLNIDEHDFPTYWYDREDISYFGDNVISRKRDLIENSEVIGPFDPRSPDGTKAIGFVKRPATFVVWDDLRVTALSSNCSTILILQKLNIPLDDFDKHVVSIGEAEALNLLSASLTSKAALTEGLFHLLKKPKEEVN